MVWRGFLPLGSFMYVAPSSRATERMTVMVASSKPTSLQRSAQISPSRMPV